MIDEADALIAADAPTIPLFNRPVFLVYRDRVHGPRNNPSVQGPFWNVEDWWLAGP